MVFSIRYAWSLFGMFGQSDCLLSAQDETEARAIILAMPTATHIVSIRESDAVLIKSAKITQVISKDADKLS